MVIYLHDSNDEADYGREKEGANEYRKIQKTIYNSKYKR